MNFTFADLHQLAWIFAIIVTSWNIAKWIDSKALQNTVKAELLDAMTESERHRATGIEVAVQHAQWESLVEQDAHDEAIEAEQERKAKLDGLLDSLKAAIAGAEKVQVRDLTPADWNHVNGTNKAQEDFKDKAPAQTLGEIAAAVSGTATA